MKQLAGFVLLGLGCAAGLGQCQVGGVLRSATTGTSIGGAVVTLRASGAGLRLSTATTDPSGAFAFSGLKPGQYQLNARKTGYKSYDSTIPVTVSQSTSLDLRLWPAGAITGRVIDWDAEPVAGAEVHAYSVFYEPTGATLAPVARARTNDLGEYRIFDLPAGKYVLQVEPPRSGTESGRFYAGTPVAYYPAATTPGGALPVHVQWGRELSSTEIRLSQGETYSIQGGVWDAAAEAPCRRCKVQAVHHDGSARVMLPQPAPTSANGWFVLRGLSSGDYRLVVQRSTSGGEAAETSASIQNRDVPDVQLILGMRQSIAGEVVLEKPPEGIDPSGWVLEMRPVNLPAGWPRGESSITQDRRFLVSELAPAQYRVELKSLPPGSYLKSVQSGGYALPGALVNISQGRSVAGLQAVVAFDAGTVQGKVRGEAGGPVTARVFLVSQASQSGSGTPASTETTSEGSFSFTSVPPGAYRLYAVPAETSVQIYDPAVQAALDRYAVRVELPPKGQANIETPIISEPQ